LGFLEKIFGKKEEPGPLNLDLDGLEGWMGGRLKGDISRWEPLVEEILDARDDARSVVEEIRDHEFPEDLKDRVYRPVLTSRPVYVKGMLSALSSIKAKPSTFEGLVDFHSSTLKTLKTIQKLQLGQGRYIAAVFTEEVPRLGTHLNRIIDSVKELGEGIAGEKEKREELETLASKIENLKEGISEGAELENRKREIEERILGLKAEVEDRKGEKERLEKSRGFRSYLHVEESLREKEEEMKGVKERALNLLAPLIRVFRKYKKLMEEGKVKGDLHRLEDYIREPVDSFLSEGEGSPALKEILEGSEKAVKEGILPLDEKEEGKIMKAKVGLEGLKREYKRLEEEREHLLAGITSSPVKKRREEMEKGIREIEEEIRGLEGELKEISSREEELGERIPKLKEEIAQAISSLEGREVNIEIR
jgi:uncharacterized protein YoxC